MNYGVSQSVQVTTGDKKKNTYPILQTKSFKYDNEIYHPVRDNLGYKYMKVLKEGYLSLYAYQPENQSNWDGRFLMKKDGDRLEVPNISFKKLMSRFLGDCPSVIAKLESGELSKPKINQIIDEYNLCIQERTQTTVQESVTTQKQDEISNPWNDLEIAIKNGNDFEGKSDALDMVADVKSKIKKNEKLPNFILEGLKNSLSQQPELKELLDKAIAGLK
jgi:hypothetical protein